MATTANQDWKTGPLNRQKYVIRKICEVCGGDGYSGCRCGTRGLAECVCIPGPCDECGRGVMGMNPGAGSIPVDPDAAYFVLRIDGNHDPHARRALACYADSVAASNPKLAHGIRLWLEETALEYKPGG